MSRAQILSRHELAPDGRDAEMMSTFVKRPGASNHSIARVPVAGFEPIDPADAHLAALAASLRGGESYRLSALT